ncbi:3'(2'),5'-bisphosphate nucleotidase CysQ [Rossellomorea sp. BNER]|uniref:3'(2'),5'-bisphosphate nucleotidase CysQ n=1 Tax=Rossellomorea sp. BNER TaxID=2962031 RepID=UPI003AF2A304|nr:3'(2'),5'-bisphosphate nucleotidase CysQ [Rossellomorea sp. BNER]
MLKDIISIALVAGKEVLKIYNSSSNIVGYKPDDSPLTLADQSSHKIILEKLKDLDPSFPILSEEGIQTPFKERTHWKTFWLIDPLDGTKEFINRNGEFTINIALIENKVPVMGVIYAPSLDTLYFAEKNQGAYKLDHSSKVKDFIRQASNLPNQTVLKPKIVVSRSHLSRETKEYINMIEENYGETELISVGSSLKFCYVAEGLAMYYPRLSPTMEWDTAAGQIIVEESGGHVLNYETNKPLCYNKDILKNPSFICKKE